MPARTSNHGPLSPIPTQLLIRSKKSGTHQQSTSNQEDNTRGVWNSDAVTEEGGGGGTFVLTEISQRGPLASHLPKEGDATMSTPSGPRRQTHTMSTSQGIVANNQHLPSTIPSLARHTPRGVRLFPVEPLSLNSQFCALLKREPYYRQRSAAHSCSSSSGSRSRRHQIYPMHVIRSRTSDGEGEDSHEAALRKLDEEVAHARKQEAELRQQAITKRAQLRRLQKLQSRHEQQHRAQLEYESRVTSKRSMRAELEDAVAEERRCQEREYLRKCEQRQMEKERHEQHLRQLENEFIQRHQTVRGLRKVHMDILHSVRAQKTSFRDRVRERTKATRDQREHETRAMKSAHMATLRAHVSEQQRTRKACESELQSEKVGLVNDRRAWCEAQLQEARTQVLTAAGRCYASKRKQRENVVQSLLAVRRTRIAQLQARLNQDEEEMHLYSSTPSWG